MRWLVAILALVACGGDADPLTITIDTGTLHGAQTGDVRHFIGIPYAAPPLGANRFRAPQPATPWTDVRAAVEAGSQCPQLLSFAGPSNDEDCLFVNVWTPSDAHELPVMVFLHGGAFVFGSGTDKYYAGDSLAGRGVVVVTLNYRLGAFGFLAHPALATDDPMYPTTGNYGLEDQRAALQWVQRNIAAFGGDPKHVTLFGESAGGFSACVHYLSSRTHGLFEAVISESGLCGSSVLELPLATAQAQAVALAEQLGCPGTDAAAIACLRGKSTDEIQAATALPTPATGMPGGPLYQPEVLPAQLPTIDGLVLATSMHAAFAAGSYEPRPIILGTNRDEGTLFHSSIYAKEVPDETAYRAALATRFTGVDGIVAHYPVSAFPSANRAIAEVTGDAFFVCPARYLARHLADHGVAVYRYSFEQALAQPFVADLGVFHSSELPFVFGNDTFPLGMIGDARPLSDAIETYWTGMAKHHDPNSAGGVAWPAYAASELSLVLAASITTTAGLKSGVCDFWDAQ